jgi:putative transposase
MSKIKNQAPFECYHIFNRGMQKQPIFESNKDRLRFLFLLLAFQGSNIIPNVSRTLKQFVQSSTLNISRDFVNEISKDKKIELMSFCLMPNHFHLIVYEKTEGGIAKYMQRVLTAYTKYFNTKYKKSGHLFQSSYKSVHIRNNNQLLYLSTYIHRNPREFSEWKNKEHLFPWSSYQDYINKNRWRGLLSRDLILDQFLDQKKGYNEFVKTSGAKELEENLDEEFLVK